MPSQLRLRAMAAGAARASQSRRGLAGVGSADPRAAADTSATRSALQSIQAAIDGLHERLPDTGSADASPYGPHSVIERVADDTSELETRQRASKRTRVESMPICENSPRPVQVDKRDGRTKLYIDGFKWTRANITSIKISYRCSVYRSQGCQAKLEFYASTMAYDFSNMTTHTSTPQAIWDVVSAKFYDRDHGAVVRGMSKSQVIKHVHRARADLFGSDIHGRVEVPPLSRVKNTTLVFFQFHHVWTNMLLKSEFMIDRVIGWAHPALLSLLRYENISLFVDGTFRCVPGKFKQCVIAIVYDRASNLDVPIFYVLAASKTYEAYWNILQYISDACGERIVRKQVVCDFEPALIKAIKDWFPDTDVVGCFFHFKQACLRKMIKLRLPKVEIGIAMEKRVLDMLTVVDPAKVARQGVAWVRSRIRERCVEDGVWYSTARWRKFWAYFLRTWVVLYGLEVCNVHGIRCDIVARTNNPLERFNRELTPHPSVPRFVQTIDEISRRYVKLREDIARGVAAAPRRDTVVELPVAVSLPDELDSADEEEDEVEEEGKQGDSDGQGTDGDVQDSDGVDSDIHYDDDEVSI